MEIVEEIKGEVFLFVTEPMAFHSKEKLSEFKIQFKQNKIMEELKKKNKEIAKLMAENHKWNII
jgi:hypothetical protein